MGRPGIAKGFGRSGKQGVPEHAGNPHGIDADEASASRSHQSLYLQHVLPCLARGNLSQAEPILKLLAQSKTDVAEVYRDLANLCESQQRLEESLVYRDLWLDHPSADETELLRQSETADHLGRKQTAAKLFEVLLKRGPKSQSSRIAVLRQLMLQECFLEARSHIESWFGQTCDSEVLELLSICAVELKESELACCLAQSCLQERSSAIAHAVLAAALQRQFREREAYDHLKTSIALSSDPQALPWPAARLLAGVCLEQNRLDMADELLQKARLDQPASRQLLAQWGELQLLCGNWTNGFRFCSASRRADLSLPSADAFELRGVAEPASEVPPLILASDGTLGDSLLFSRYAPWITTALSRPVHLYVQPPVLRLLRDSFQAPIEVHPIGELTSHPSEWILPMQDAPAVFGACDQQPVLAAPCLRADPALVEVWRKRLDLGSGERLIGINWNGSALQASRERVSSDIPLNAFSAIAQRPGVRLVSLQKGFGAEQLRHCRFADRFVSCQNEVSHEVRLEHMAALITLCEWVICDDSGPAHLAGSLSSPTILLLPERAGWRWGGFCSRSPWYPTLHLLRRSESKGWDDLMSEASELMN